MGRIFEHFNDEKWEQVRTHPYFKKYRENVIATAERNMVTDPPVIKFSLIHRYVVDGNREVFERDYNNYFGRLNNLFAAYMLTKDEKYLVPLADIIWNICDFESWSIPAHVKESLTVAQRRQNLDLCSTIAGYRLSEVLYFIGDKLPELVVKRARAEIRYRVIESYKSATADRFWWLKAENNWSSVCAAAVLATFIYAAEKHEIDAQIPRLIDNVKYYLRGFSDDGCCGEGYGYWNYGFSFFCVFAQLLREYTDGKIDMFKDPKVQKIARFQEFVPINERQCVSFSDAGDDFKPYSWLSHFLKNVYPELRIPAIPAIENPDAPMRYVLWQDTELNYSSLNATEPISFTFDEAQWFIYRCKDYSFACKAGHNNEQHNHNDVGSFIFSKGAGITFCDPGVGQYTRQYFSSERYDLMLTSSRGHSVPIINGRYQICTGARSELYVKERNKYGFSMEKVYDVENLRSLRRDFSCEDDGVVLTDTYEFDGAPEGVTERFISLHPITLLDGGRIGCGDSVMEYDASAFDASVGSEEVERKQSKTGTVYYVDLKVKKPASSMKFTFKFL